MANAAIYFNPEAYDTSKKTLMGRHSAGEGFFRGFLRHADVDRFQIWNVVGGPQQEFLELINRIEPVQKPIQWINRGDHLGLSKVGAVHIPTPVLGHPAWSRRVLDARAYSITGITHTTATAGVMDELANNIIAPLEPWDALICTSRAVKASVEAYLEGVSEYLGSRFGGDPQPRFRTELIHLGVNTSDFQVRPADRKSWRERLNIEEDDIVVLYVGRYNVTSKMNPVPMAIGLERAAARTGRKIHWVLAGWAATEDLDKHFKFSVTNWCPSITCHFVDGREPASRFSIWAAGDIFLSLSDNIQETFGLTPLEAMAAGLPSVITDWDGYKDTVRHGVDGFRIPTYTPRAGVGGDFGYRYANSWDSYDAYVAGVAQFTSIDLEETTNALVQLIENRELRLRMGAAGQARALSTFDWKVIIPKYQALWAELNAIRRAAPPKTQVRNLTQNPWRPDPFHLFASYPTEWVRPSTMISLSEGFSAENLDVMLGRPLVRMAHWYLPQREEIVRMIELIGAKPQVLVGDVIAEFPPARRGFLERAVVWMAKYGMVTILARGVQIPA